MQGGADALKIIRYAAGLRPERPADDPRHRSYGGNWELIAWSIAAILLIAGPFYSMGQQSRRKAAAANSSATSAGPTPAVPSGRQREAPSFYAVRIPAPEPAARLADSASNAASGEGSAVLTAPSEAKGARITGSVEAGPSQSRQRSAEDEGIWPAQTVEGASGRLVRIGKFSTAGEATEGWQAVIKEYPGMGRLPSLPVPIKSLRDGHIYYRLQVGTTSPAHSEVLCQRMQKMRQSCAVIGADEPTGESAI